MKTSRKVSFAASAMTVAAIPALVACGGDDDQEAAQPTPTEPVGNTGGNSTAAPTQAPAQSQILFVDVDVLRGSRNVAEADKATQSCVQLNMFQKNEQIVWRVRVFDPMTGAELDDKAIDKIVIKLKDGTELDPMKYGGRPRDAPTIFFWTQSFVIPEDFPVGSVEYTVSATDKEGRSGTFVPLNYGAVLQVMDSVRPVIPQ